MRITHAKLSGLAPTGRGKRRVTICAELGTSNEFLNITVDVPGMGTEVEVCERGIERAKCLPVSSLNYLPKYFLASVTPPNDSLD